MIQYRKEIDGLRALAIITVLIFHFFPMYLPYGYLGVDIFFVISGYLITLHLLTLRDRKKSKVLKEFYIRRIKRLFPALFVFLFITTLIASFVLLPHDFTKFSSSLFASQTFWANWFFWRDGGYFGGDDHLKPLLHMWSLSVEEQFYIFFPTFLFLLIFISKKAGFGLLYLITAIVGVSFTLWLFLHKIDGSTPAFFLLPTRVWEFGLGTIIAVVHFQDRFSVSSDRVSNLLMFTSLAILVVGFSQLMGRVPSTAAIILGTALFIYNRGSNNIMVVAFSNSISMWLGKISYSVYLYHWPIAVFSLYYFIETPPFLISIIGLIASVLLGWLSFRFVEKPFRYNLSFKYTLIIISLSVVASYSIISYKSQVNEDQSLTDSWSSSTGTHFRCSPQSYVSYGASRACGLGSSNRPNEIILLGNSHAQMYAPLFDVALKESQLGGLLVPLNSCLPTTTVNVSTKCIQDAQSNLEAILNDSDVKAVVIALTWYKDIYIDNEGKDIDSGYLIQGVDNLIDQLRSRGISTALMSPIQIPNSNLTSIIPRKVLFGHIGIEEAKDLLSLPKQRYEDKFLKLNSYFDSKLGDGYIKVYEDLCNDLDCLFAKGDLMYYSDSNHLSSYALDELTKTKASIGKFIISLEEDAITLP